MTVDELISKLEGYRITHPEARVVISENGPVTMEIADITHGHILEGSHLLARCDGGDCIPTQHAVVVIPK